MSSDASAIARELCPLVLPVPQPLAQGAPHMLAQESGRGASEGSEAAERERAERQRRPQTIASHLPARRTASQACAGRAPSRAERARTLLTWQRLETLERMEGGDRELGRDRLTHHTPPERKAHSRGQCTHKGQGTRKPATVATPHSTHTAGAGSAQGQTPPRS